MPLKTELVEEPQLNLTPMIDMVFLLITFFMISWQFTRSEREFDIDLPTAAIAPVLTSRPDELSITVRASGEIQVNGKARTLEELEADLMAARKNYPDQAVVIRGEGQGTYQNVVDVLAACERAKITSVSLPVRTKAEAPR